MYCVTELCYILNISFFHFLICIHFTYQRLSKQSLAQKLAQNLKLIFKFSWIKRQINIPRWTYMGHKEWKKGERWKAFSNMFYHCFEISRWNQCKFCFAVFLKLLVNKNLTSLSQKCQKKIVRSFKVALYTDIQQKIFNISILRNTLPWCSEKL